MPREEEGKRQLLVYPLYLGEVDHAPCLPLVLFCLWIAGVRGAVNKRVISLSNKYRYCKPFVNKAKHNRINEMQNTNRYTLNHFAPKRVTAHRTWGVRNTFQSLLMSPLSFVSNTRSHVLPHSSDEETVSVSKLTQVHTGAESGTKNERHWGGPWFWIKS